jgi:hypothetical protein
MENHFHQLLEKREPTLVAGIFTRVSISQKVGGKPVSIRWQLKC